MQHHVVFGAGLIGRYLGSVMAHQELKVSLVCRPAIATAIENGITLTDYQEHRCEVNNLTVIPANDEKKDAFNLDVADVVWLTVKCTGVEAAAKSMTSFVGPHTTIICCQNGLGSDHLVKQQYPDNRILRAMVPFNVVELSPSHMHRGSEGTFTIEAREGQDADIQALSETLRCGLLPCDTSSQMSELLWAKLQLNLGNSINALADIPVKAMLEQRGYRLVIAAMMRELLAVVKAQGMNLPKVAALPGWMLPHILALPNGLFRLVANKMLAIDPTVRTSMWWDIHQGRKTEIQYLNGAIIQAAEPLKLACPVNRAVVALIQEREGKKVAWPSDKLVKQVLG